MGQDVLLGLAVSEAGCSCLLATVAGAVHDTLATATGGGYSCQLPVGLAGGARRLSSVHDAADVFGCSTARIVCCRSMLVMGSGRFSGVRAAAVDQAAVLTLAVVFAAAACWL
jgi:hypothetical protein